MPKVPVPDQVSEFLARPNPAVIATLRPDGSPHTVATWYDWEEGLVLVNMDRSRLRLKFLEKSPRFSLTALDNKSWYRHISLLGHVVSIADDTDLVDIDRLSLRYTGRPFGRRDAKRVSAWLEPDRWHGWSDAGPWP
ncbi:MAG TPA: TIGR03618 family F420-dependent PPOX class oxidoreductase [Gaiellaceae bacterium]